jgi:hypothetical protein
VWQEARSVRGNRHCLQNREGGRLTSEVDERAPQPQRGHIGLAHITAALATPVSTHIDNVLSTGASVRYLTNRYLLLGIPFDYCGELQQLPRMLTPGGALTYLGPKEFRHALPRQIGTGDIVGGAPLIGEGMSGVIAIDLVGDRGRAKRSFEIVDGRR